MNMEKLGQIQLPAPEDFDPHPRLLLNGRGIHAGETFRALFPDGWREITIEMSWEPEGPGCIHCLASSKLPLFILCINLLCMETISVMSFWVSAGNTAL